MESASQPKGIIMHNRFRRACYTLAGGVAVTAALGLTAAGAANASTSGIRPVGPDATTACGNLCNDLFNLALGEKFIQNTSGHYGGYVDLAPAHNYKPSEDFIATEVGDLGDFCKIDGGSGLIPDNAYVCLNYPSSWPVFQNEYSPGSFTSDLCIGVARNHVKQGGAVTLRVCGTSARTLWVADLANEVKDPASVFGFDSPWVNAADSRTSNALSLTTNDFGDLYLSHLRKNGGVANDNQEFGVNPGPAI